MNALFTDLFERLHKEASAETSHKAYHQKVMATSTENKEDPEAQVAKHSSNLKSAFAGSNTSAGEVAEIQEDRGALAAQQLKMDTLRGKERKFLPRPGRTSNRVAGNEPNFLKNLAELSLSHGSGGRVIIRQAPSVGPFCDGVQAAGYQVQAG